MTIFYFKDIINDNLKLGNSNLDNFVKNVKQNISPIHKENLSKKLNNPFCLLVKNKIALTRYALEILLEIDGLKEIEEAGLIKLLKNFDQNFLKNNYFDFESGSFSGKTELKQEFVCYAIWYLFRNQQSSIQDFHFHLQSITADEKDQYLKITGSTTKFLYGSLINNYSFVIDAYCTAKTILYNKTKMKLKTDLSTLYVGEEKMCKDFKETPFKILKKKIKNYYKDSNVLTKADIYIWNKGHEDYDNFITDITVNIKSVEDKKAHEFYRVAINSAIGKGFLIPISLKKLTRNNINSQYVTNKFKAIGSTERLGRDTSDIQDPYLRTVQYLFSLDNRSEFFQKLNEIVDIKYNSTDLYFSAAKNKTSIEFAIKFIKLPASVAKSKIKDTELVSNPEKFSIVFEAGSLKIVPEGSTSPTGLGSINRIDLETNFINNMPSIRYKNDLIKKREQAYSEFLLKVQPKQNKSNFLKSKNILIRKDLTQVFPEVKNKNYNNIQLFCELYFEKLFTDSKISTKMREKLNKPGGIMYDLKSAGSYIFQRVSQAEFLYLLVCNENIVRDYLKKSFIMSIYSMSSGVGSILVYRKGKKYTIKGRDAVRDNVGTKLNPIFYKVGI